MSPQTSSADYWQKAYDSLSSEVQANLQHAQTGRRDIVEAVLRTAEEKQEICFRKRWRFTLRGQPVVVRDVIEKITIWIQRFIAVGDTAIQYNTASAAIPWAAFRFLLQAAISDTQFESALVSDLETMSRLITRYREFERIHLQRNSTIKPRIEECLTRLYADILSFLSMAVGHFSSNALARTTKNMFRYSSINHSQKILEQEAEVLKIAGLSDSEKLFYLEDSVAFLVDRTAVYDKNIEKSKHLKLVQWLSKVPISAHHTLRSEERMPGSANWILDRHEYKSWKHTNSSAALLLHGIAGSGKSIICSAVIDQMQQETNHQIARFAYFYCADCKFEPERSQPPEILRSILKQLAIDQSRRHLVPDFIRSEFDRRVTQSNVDGLEVQTLSIQDSVKFIQNVTAQYPITIVIDALDEIEEFNRPSLVEALKQIIADSLNIVKVFLTTRSDGHIFALLSDDLEGSTKSPTLGNNSVQKIRVSREDTQADMEAYVKLQLSIMKSGRHLLKGKMSSELSQVLVKKLLDGAGEMFQWVSIQLRHICIQDREEDIMKILDDDKFATLDDIYSAVLEGILQKGGVSCEIAIRTFSWLLFMQESVPSQSLLSIVTRRLLSIGVEFQSPDLMNICSNLVLLDEKRDTFRFSHQSVQEFLRKHERLSADAANSLLSNNCLQICIEGPSIDAEVEQQSSNAVYRYAAIYWPHHFSSIHEKQKYDAVFANVLSFIYDSPNDTSLSFMAWMDQVEQIAGTLPNGHPMQIIQDAIPNSDYSPLFMASIFGLDGLIKAVDESSDDQAWDQVNHCGHTSLYLSCAYGHAPIAKELIKNGANPNVKCGRFGTCLQAACFNGHAAVVSLLLSQGALIYQPGTFSNALEAAFRGQQEDIVLLLLQQDPAIRNQEDYLEVVGGAALSGFLRVLEHLETSPLTSVYNTPVDKMKFKISKAIRGGQHGVLSRFFKNAQDIAAILPQEAISLAAVYGHDAVVKLLANKGSLEGGQNLGSPLRCASMMNRESTVRLLINLGADVNMLDAYGSALQAASMNGHTRIVKLLLAEGAKVNQQGGIYGTALQAAAYHGHREIVDLLLESSASAYISGLAKDAFHAAVEGGHHDIIQHMLERGLLDKRARLNFASSRSMASMAGPPIYKSLLRDSSPSRRLANGRSQRQMRSPSLSTDNVFEQPGTEGEDVLAAMGEMGIDRPSQRSTKNFKFIYSQDKGINSKISPLATCADIGNVVAVSAMLERKKKLGFRNEDILQALKVAATNGYTVIIHQLLEHTPVPLPVADGFEILEEAVSNCHFEATSLLLEQINSHGWDSKSLQDLVTRACRSNVPIIEAIITFVQTFLSIEDVNQMLENSFRHSADEGKDEVKVDVIDWIYKRIGIACQSHCRDVFKVACNRNLQTTAARILRIAGKNGIGKEDVLQGAIICASEGYLELLACLNDFLLFEGKVSNVDLMRAACKNGHLSIVDWLLKRPHQLGDITLGLVIASSNGHSQVVQTLLEAGADVNAAVAVSTSDLELSRLNPSYSRRDKVITALQAVFNRLASNASHFVFAKSVCVHDLETIIRSLLDHGADVNSSLAHTTPFYGNALHLKNGCSTSPLFVAAHCGSQRLVRWLIDVGADVNAMVDGHDVLTAATSREELCFEIMQILLGSGAQLRSNADSIRRIFKSTLRFFDEGEGEGRFINTNSLSDVFTRGPGAVLRFLLEKTHWNESSPQFSLILQMVCILGDGGYVDLLLERGVDVNTVCSYYGTALQAAARHGHTDLVQKLLKFGADPNVTGGAHSTALRAAVNGGHSGIVQTLLSFSANVHRPSFTSHPESTSKNDSSLIALAVELSDKEIISLLPKASVDANVTRGAHSADIYRPSFTSYPDYTRKNGSSLITLAAELADEEITSLLLKAGVDANTSAAEQQHALILACASGNIIMVRHLLAAGTRPDVIVEGSWTIEDGWYSEMTSLHMCSYHGNEELMQLLLQNDTNLEIETQCSGTPLIVAANRGFSSIICLLAAAGADINHKTSRFGTSLSAAAGEGQLDAVRTLLAVGASAYNPARDINSLICSWRSDSLPVLELLAKAAVSVPNGKLAITKAIESWCDWKLSDLAENWSEAHLRLLIDYVGPSTKGLLAACILGSVSIVKSMLDNGVPANGGTISGYGALRLAAQYLHPNVVQMLLYHGADPHDQSTETGNIINAAMLGCVENCLPDEAKPENPKSRHRARIAGYWTWGSDQESNSEKIVKLLVACGIEITDTPFKFGTSLHLACFMGNESIITMLLSKGSDVNSHAGYFENPLFAAIIQNHHKTIELLLNNGANPNSCHSRLGPALAYAIQGGKFQIINLLLQHGADPNTKGKLECSLLVSIIMKKGFSRLHKIQLVSQILKNDQPLKICDSDLAAVIKSEFSVDGKSAVEILLEHNTQMIVSENTIISLLGSNQYPGQLQYTKFEVLLKLFLKRSINNAVTPAMLQHAQNLAQMNILLAHQPRCPITTDIVESQPSIDLMTLLLEHEPNMKSTQAMVTQLIKNRKRHNNTHKKTIVDVLQELWRRNSGLRVTEVMFEDMDSLDPDTVQFLLSHSPLDLQLSQSAFLSANANNYHSVQLLRLLLKYNPHVQIEEETVAKIIERNRSAEKLDIFIESKPTMLISERMFLAALRSQKEAFAYKNPIVRERALNEVREVAEVLKKHRKTVEITDAIRKTIDEFFERPDQSAEKELFYSRITV
ncbi:ankyrin repeat-containing domain protein [Xylaria scruposa]|nr:ankyrin repeat-containing domain protein [Xylaria scruposa]